MHLFADNFYLSIPKVRWKKIIVIKKQVIYKYRNKFTHVGVILHVSITD